MRDQMEAGMTEATRLTREGRLAEATAVIQRALGGTFAKASPVGPGSADRPVEVFSRVVEEAPQPTAPSGPGRKEHALRQAPRAPRHFRGAPHRSGNFPGTMPGPGPDATTPDTVSTAGQFVERSYSGQAGARGYKLYIPSGYTGPAGRWPPSSARPTPTSTPRSGSIPVSLRAPPTTSPPRSPRCRAGDHPVCLATPLTGSPPGSCRRSCSTGIATRPSTPGTGRTFSRTSGPAIPPADGTSGAKW